jgi:hypothetical protein
MEHDVCVAVACKAPLVRDLTTHENKRAVLFNGRESVDIEPLPDPDRSHRSTW